MLKNHFLILSVALILTLLMACGATDTIFKTLEKTKFSPPLGLRSVTQDKQVTLYWYTSNYEKDFGGYFILKAQGDYTSSSSDSSLNETIFFKADSLILTGSSDKVQQKTITGLTNGITYSFAVVAFDKDDKEKISYPSNIIADTPRPGINTVVVKSASTNDVTGDDSKAGFDFNNFTVVDVPVSDYINTNGADIINEAFDLSAANTNIRPWLAGMNGAGIQDLGYMSDLDGTDVAPSGGYSDQGKSISVLLNHVYAVKTGDGGYGKLLVTSIGGAPDYSITFNAAFQTKLNDRNYKIVDWNYLLGIH
jgi:hypothetical protein